MANIHSHYIPQRFLQNFSVSDQGTEVWRLDRELGDIKCLPIKAVAQSNGFYDQETEEWLNEIVEGPVWKPLDDLLRQRELDERSRLRISEFLSVMFWRQMAVRNWIINPLPSLKPHVAGMLLSESEKWVSPKYPTGEAFRGALTRWGKDGGDGGHAPIQPNHPMLAHVRRDPWLTTIINQMSWRVGQITEGQLITGDSPMFIDPGPDPFNPDPEFSIALSPDTFLHGAWHQDEAGKIRYCRAGEGARNEINIRTAFWSVRYLFAAQPLEPPLLLPRESYSWNSMTWVQQLPSRGKLPKPPYLSKRLFEETARDCI